MTLKWRRQFAGLGPPRHIKEDTINLAKWLKFRQMDPQAHIHACISKANHEQNIDGLTHGLTFGLTDMQCTVLSDCNDILNA